MMTDEPLPVFRGDIVRVIYLGKTTNAIVMMSGQAGRGLMLGFRQILGEFVGSMPVMWDDKTRTYRDIIFRNVVVITRGES